MRLSQSTEQLGFGVGGFEMRRRPVSQEASVRSSVVVGGCSIRGSLQLSPGCPRQSDRHLDITRDPTMDS